MKSSHRVLLWVIFFHQLSAVISDHQYPSRILNQVYGDEVWRRSLTTSNYSNPYDNFVPSQYMVMNMNFLDE